METELEKEERGGGEADQDEIDGDVSDSLWLFFVSRANCVQEFTMPMMLKSINVDLVLIGYDRENQRWAD